MVNNNKVSQYFNFTEEQIRKMDPLTAFRLGECKVLAEQADENKKHFEELEPIRKQTLLELEVIRKRLGIG